MPYEPFSGGKRRKGKKSAARKGKRRKARRSSSDRYDYDDGLYSRWGDSVFGPRFQRLGVPPMFPRAPLGLVLPDVKTDISKVLAAEAAAAAPAVSTATQTPAPTASVGVGTGTVRGMYGGGLEFMTGGLWDALNNV